MTSDLEIDNLSVSDDSVSIGGSITINWDVLNTGSSDASTTRSGIYLISSDFTQTWFLGSQSAGSSPAGSSDSETQDIVIPDDVPSGTYLISVFADYDFRVDEANENNNVQSVFIDVVENNLPDLFISDVDVGSQDIAFGDTVNQIYSPGQTFSVVVDIENIGNGPAGSSTLAGYLVIDGVSHRLDTNSTRALSAGSTDSNETIQFVLPSNLDDGRYSVILIADYDNDVAESVEDNNGFGFLIDVFSDTVREGTDTTTVLTEGSWLQGTIDDEPIPGDGETDDLQDGEVDKDWYQVTLDANRTYTFEAESLSLTTGRVAVRLYDSDGNPVASTFVSGSSPEFSFETDDSGGTYYLAVSASDTNNSDFRLATGDFRLRLTDEGSTITADTVREGTDTTTTLTEGVWLEGSIDDEPISGDGETSDLQGGFVDKDWYEVVLDPNRNYTFEAESLSLTTGEVFIRLYDGSGTRVYSSTHDDGSSASFDFTTESSGGTYYLAISASDKKMTV